MPLQPNSLAFAKRDPALSGLRLLLDEAALARQLGAGQLSRLDLRYKCGVSCVAGLHLAEADDEEKWLCAKALTPERFEQIKKRTNWFSGRWRVKLVEDQHVAFIPPQLDRKLKILAKLLDPEKQDKTLSQITGHCLTAPKLRIMRYKPNRRLVAQVIDHANGRKALLKIQRSTAFDAAMRGARVAMMLGGPRVLATVRRHGAITTEWLPGTSLCPVEGAADRALFRLAGARLAKQHQSSFRLPHLPRSAEIQSLRQVTSDLSRIIPDQAKRLTRIAQWAIAALLSQPTRRGLIHGDFSADQVLANGGETVVIDWDRAATGDQGRDIGSFLARLDMQSLAGLITHKDAEDLKSGFLDGYREHNRCPVSYRAQQICHLVLLLTEPFRKHGPNWYGLTITLMDHIEKLLEGVPIVVTDPALPHLADALSSEVAGSLINDQAPLTLASQPTLYRHKPGKRAMIRYDCRTDNGGTRTLLSKMRSKGRDKRATALHTALRAAGLNGKGSAKVGVPAVIDVKNDADMWFMEHVPGTCLRDLQDKDQPECFFRAGAALGHLHNSGVVPDRVWSREQELGVVAAALGKAAMTQPHHKPRLKALLAWAEEAMRALPCERPTCIHRDFYPDQVIVQEDRIWLVDLDLVALGDPAIDVGNFLAHLTEYAIRKNSTPAASETLEEAFLSGYQTTGFDIPLRSIKTLKSISLIRHIYISQLFEDRQRTTETLLSDEWLEGLAK